MNFFLVTSPDACTNQKSYQLTQKLLLMSKIFYGPSVI